MGQTFVEDISSDLKVKQDLELQVLTEPYTVGEIFRHTDGLNYRVKTDAAAGETPTTDPGKFDLIGGGTGDVSGPVGSTDNALARFDSTTGKLLQNSVATLSDAGSLAGLTLLNVDNIRVNGNDIASTDTNGNITLSPDGSGDTIINSGLQIIGDMAGNQGGFSVGDVVIKNTGTDINSSANITGHNSNSGDRQLWFFGNSSSSNENMTILNRRNGNVEIGTNNTVRFTVNANGDIKLSQYPNTRDDGTPLNILGTDANGNLISGPNEVIHIGGNFIDTTDQAIVTASTPQEITFNTNKLIEGITHTAGSAAFTIDNAGVYQFIIAPQVGQGSGAATIEFWIEKNGTTIADSGIQETVSANSEVLPILRWKERFVATDTFKIIWASNSVNTKLDNIASLFGGANIPSIMLGVTHQGS